VVATAPAILHLRTSFLAGGSPALGEAAPGDHLQTLYRFWLVGHQLEHGRAPWLDPYTFQPEVEPQLNLGGWPFGLPLWPLFALLGPVVTWNVFTLLSYVGAGGFACAWLRELQLPRGSALAGGLAFALAPYRAAQSAGHLLGPIALLLPAALWAFERSRRGSAWWSVAAAAALASIPLSGQVHLALGAVPFYATYVLARTRAPRQLLAAAGAVAAAVAAGLFVQQTQIAGSISSGGRSLDEVAAYSAEWLDFLTRHQRHGNESFVFLGWLTPLVAAAGLVALVRVRRLALAAVLGLGSLVPILLALGTNLPLYRTLWHWFAPLRYPRVPERFMPIACLALAALVAFAVARLRFRLAPLVALLVLALDLHVHVYDATAADGGSRVYDALKNAAPGRLLELPVFDPGTHYGGIYMYYDMRVLRERPGGYSTLAPNKARTVARALEPLGCGEWNPRAREALSRLGVRWITLHESLFGRGTTLPRTPWFAWRGLRANGWNVVAADGGIVLYGRRGADGSSLAPPPEPSRTQPWLCAGWGDRHRDGRHADEPHATLWVYGTGTGSLTLDVREGAATVAVDGHVAARRDTEGTTDVAVPLRGRRWHMVAVDTSKKADVWLRRVTYPSSGSPSRRTASSP
jgi:hypothetical protein